MTPARRAVLADRAVTMDSLHRWDAEWAGIFNAAKGRPAARSDALRGWTQAGQAIKRVQAAWRAADDRARRKR